MLGLWGNLQAELARIENLRQGPLTNLAVLELGPGQGLERAHYFSLDNQVTTIDLDVIPRGLDLPAYFRMWRRNGPGRVLKTIGRELLSNRGNRRAWAKAIGRDDFSPLTMLDGDVQISPLSSGAFDAIVSWSVFEHLPESRAALSNLCQALRPGGVLYLSIHLYTCNNGHHDMRAFTGHEDALPLWAHLRPNTRHLVSPSAYLNEWRLAQWRDLFDELTPGYQEFLDQYEHPEVYGPLLEGQLGAELSDYSREELLTVNAVYGWRKPAK